MIFRTSGPVFQSQSVLDGQNNLSIRFQMSGYDLKKIHIWVLTLDIRFPILKHTDQGNIIIFFCQILLYLLKVSHKNPKVILILMSVCIDLASLHRKLNTGNFFRFLTQSTCDGPTSGTDLQDLFLSGKWKPV